MAEMYEIFEQPQYTKWNAFRDSDDARYIGLAMPRFLLRKPYTVEDQDVKDFVFEEDVRDSRPTTATSGATPRSRWPAA